MRNEADSMGVIKERGDRVRGRRSGGLLAAHGTTHRGGLAECVPKPPKFRGLVPMVLQGHSRAFFLPGCSTWAERILITPIVEKEQALHVV